MTGYAFTFRVLVLSCFFSAIFFYAANPEAVTNITKKAPYVYYSALIVLSVLAALCFAWASSIEQNSNKKMAIISAGEKIFLSFLYVIAGTILIFAENEIKIASFSSLIFIETGRYIVKIVALISYTFGVFTLWPAIVTLEDILWHGRHKNN